MARPINTQEMERLSQTIVYCPGQSIGELARLLGWTCEKVSRLLVTLNDQNILFWEDEKGGVWPFNKQIG